MKTGRGLKKVTNFRADLFTQANLSDSDVKVLMFGSSHDVQPP